MNKGYNITFRWDFESVIENVDSVYAEELAIDLATRELDYLIRKGLICADDFDIEITDVRDVTDDELELYYV